MKDIEPPGPLHTARLILRPWREPDRVPFAAMNADPEVMEHFPQALDRAESDAFFDRLQTSWDEDGFGWLAVTLPNGAFLGGAGLLRPSFQAGFTPCVEVGWRFARHAWGNGYATEAAKVSLAWGFGARGLDEIVSFTAVSNARSIRVMERLGMVLDGPFEHPAMSVGHPLRPHVLYRLPRDLWEARQ